MAKRLTKAAVDEVLRVGQMMSNLCFNWGQMHDHPTGPEYVARQIDARQLKSMRDMQRDWDEAVQKLKAK